ncbi:hypothetical protein HZS_3027 [Henneguya salminicola]|nr:hypothetical protein HZS_3027 [Henneguya salminicola]
MFAEIAFILAYEALVKPVCTNKKGFEQLFRELLNYHEDTVCHQRTYSSLISHSLVEPIQKN